MQEGNNGRLPVLVLELQLLLVTQGIQEGIGRNRLHTRMDANEGSGNTAVYGEGRLIWSCVSCGEAQDMRCDRIAEFRWEESEKLRNRIVMLGMSSFVTAFCKP